MQTVKKRCRGRFLLLILTLLLSVTYTMAQQPKSNAVPYWNNALSRIAYMPETPGWYRFREAAVKNPERFFVDYKTLMGLTDADDMKLQKTTKDETARRHLRFQQYFKGIKIEGAEFILHEKNGFVSSGNGKLVYQMAKSITPAISEAAALQKALAAVPSNRYRVDAKTIVDRAAYQPNAELVFQRPDNDILFAPENFRLCYKFLVETNSAQAYAVYIDAANGSLVQKIPLFANEEYCKSTTATLAHGYGVKAFKTSYNPVNKNYSLHDACTDEAIWILDAQNDTIPHGTEFLSATNLDWSSSFRKRSAATTLWCARRTIDFYKALFARKGFDDKNTILTINQNWGFAYTDDKNVRRVGYDNASYYNGTIYIGNSDGNSTNTDADDWNTLDILGHEFTHGVTGAAGSSQLVYRGESGALNESFSDIMGTYLEWWDNSTPFDWLVSEDRGAIRDMSNPNAYSNPDTYGGTFWFNPADWSSDNGGVHTNSGVQNFWFYLLSNGGSGKNDFGTAYSVQGIGIQTAGFLAYKANVDYLTSTSSYSDSRAATTQAAIDYYGYCSNVSLQVSAAWDAVGVVRYAPLVNNWGNTPAACGSYSATTDFVHFYSTASLDVAKSCAITFNPSSAPYGYAIAAVNTVHLYPGFSAKAGANVDIFIASCANGSTLPRIVQPQMRELQAVEEHSFALPKTEPTGLTIYPNPASSVVQLEFTVVQDEKAVIVHVYNTLMQEVRQKLLGALSKGKQTARVDLNGLVPGTYILELQAGSQKLKEKVLLLR